MTDGSVLILTTDEIISNGIEDTLSNLQHGSKIHLQLVKLKIPEAPETKDLPQELSKHKVVILDTTNASVPNSKYIGDILYDFVTHGGALICSMYTNISASSYSTQTVYGKLQDIHALTYATVAEYPPGLRMTTVHEPSHPIMHGVSRYVGGESSCFGHCTPNQDALLIASYENGHPLIAVRSHANGVVIGLNYNACPAPELYFSYQKGKSDGHIILFNAVQYGLTWKAKWLFRGKWEKLAYHDVQFVLWE